MNRRDFVISGGLFISAAALPRQALSQPAPGAGPAPCPVLPPNTVQVVLPPKRPPITRYSRVPEMQRRFTCSAVEGKIREIQAIATPELGWLFENCYPNTLDTTITFTGGAGREDTFVITGDIPAMWLRDSTAQTAVYLPLARSEPALQALFRGLIRRQSRCVLLDPYANAFYADARYGEFCNDTTTMKRGVHERKWEVDSLCYPIRLSYLYWKATGDTSAFDDDWRAAMKLIVETFRTEQRLDGKTPYRFSRKAAWFYDNSPNSGAGNPTRKIGLIHSAFRPSDDCCFYPFLIPSNMFAEVSLRQLAEMAASVLDDDQLRTACLSMADELHRAIMRFAICRHPEKGNIYAFEVDGYGNALMMDDANVPSLLALPYLGCCSPAGATYRRTRQFVLSDSNPYFHRGRLAEGIGGPHVGPTKIWPLSIIMRALTSNDDREIVNCLRMLVGTHAGTGLMHESFDPDRPEDFTRPWFAWCNSLFGELIVNVAERKPALLRSV